MSQEGFMVFVLDDSMLEFPPDRTQDSTTFGDFVVTRETDNTETQRTHRGEEEEEDCHWNMETLEAEGITSAYEQHTGKLQPKPRLLGTVIEEPDSDDYTTRATNHDVESRNDESNTNTTFSRELQEAEEDNIPQVPRETVHGGCEDEQHVVSTSTKNTVIGEKEETQSGRESKKGKSKRARKGKATTSQEEEEPNSKAPEEKKLKHSSRRQRNRTLDKELLETPDDDIKHLPIKDMLPLFEYRNWLEKKKAKGAPALPPAQESNTNAWEDNQYYSQGFDAEDEFGMVETENQEINVVKPDSPVNYQTYMNKTPRTRWSKQDTQLFYEGIRDFGSDLSMVQQLSFPERTRQQIKLKFKSEERKFPLKLNEALSTRSKDLVRCHNLIKKLQQKAAAARDGEEEEAGKEAETTIDVPENEEPAKSEGAGDGVKESEGGDEYEDNDDDDDFWNSYKSEM